MHTQRIPNNDANVGYLFSFARRTATRASIALGLTEYDWSAFCCLFNKPRVDYDPARDSRP